jgi:hypothetical protein
VWDFCDGPSASAPLAVSGRCTGRRSYLRQSVIAPQQARFGHSGKNALLMAGKICISPANSFNLPARLPTLFFAGKPPWPN